MVINLTTKFLPFVDELFTTESKKALVTTADAFSWSGAHTIKINMVNTVGMNDYDRAGTKGTVSRYGEYGVIGNDVVEITLKKDRSFTFVIDKLDRDETQLVLDGGSALARQQREVIIPEVDAYVFKTMAEYAGTKVSDVTLTKDNIYTEIIKGSNVLDNNEVPETRRVLLVPPDTYFLMKQCKDIIMETDIAEDMRLKGVISNLDGLTVVKVPKIRLPENAGFMIAHPSATVAPTKLEDFTIHQNPPGISGELVEGRICYGAFVLENKEKAIYYAENKPATQSGS